MGAWRDGAASWESDVDMRVCFRRLSLVGTAFAPSIALALCVSFGLIYSTSARADLTTRLLRADDGTSYFVMTHTSEDNSGQGIDAVALTTLAGSTLGLDVCGISGTFFPPRNVEATSASTPLGIIPLQDVRKSMRFSDASIPCIDMTGSGRVCIGPGCTPGPACSCTGDCVTFAFNEGAPLSTGTPDAPAAHLDTNWSVQNQNCSVFNRATYRFSTSSPTTSVPPCGQQPTDAIILPSGPSSFSGGVDGTTMVIAFRVDPADPLEIGAAGFKIDLDGENAIGCMMNSVLGAVTAEKNHSGFAPTPTPTFTFTSTPTVTNTPTYTHTFTSTPTPTWTHTPTHTHTHTHTRTNTPTNTATFTHTHTPTHTYTFTHTFTPTHTPTPTNTFTPTYTFTPTPFCGNGIAEGPEQCDDNNTEDGDCCSSTCQLEPINSPCTSDDNSCTNDICNGQGTCLHNVFSDGTACDDGSVCTSGTQCFGGQCGGGLTKSCDDGDDCTTDTCDPLLDCQNNVEVETFECNSCTDGIDNDHNGIVDAENAACATFFRFQRYAVIGTATEGSRSVKFNRKVSVTEATERVGDAAIGMRAGTCSIDIKASVGVHVSGSIASERNSRFSGGKPEIEIGVEFLNNGNDPVTGKHEPLVGGPGFCSDGVTLCPLNGSCPGGGICSIPLSLKDPRNTWVDMTGTAPDYIRCETIQDELPNIERILTGLPSTMDIPEIRLRRNGNFQIDLQPGQNVIDIGSVRVGADSNITINGPENSWVVFRIPGRFRIGTRSKVLTAGGISPNNVMWDIQGVGRRGRIASRVEFEGTVIGAKRPTFSVGAFAVVRGAFWARRVRMGGLSAVEHMPFTPLLEGVVDTSPNVAIKRIAIRRSNSRRPNGRVRMVLFIDDDDSQSLQTDLLNGVVSFRVTDSAVFDASIPISGCQRRNSRVIKCRNGNIRGVFKARRDDPNIYQANIVRRRIPVPEAGVVQPTAPVVVDMDQTPGLERTGRITTCRRRGNFTVACRRR